MFDEANDGNDCHIIPREDKQPPSRFQDSISDVGPTTATGGNTFRAQSNGLMNEVLEVHSNPGNLEQNRRLESALNEQVNHAQALLSQKRAKDHLQKRKGTQSVHSERQLSSKKAILTHMAPAVTNKINNSSCHHKQNH